MPMAMPKGKRLGRGGEQPVRRLRRPAIGGHEQHAKAGQWSLRVGLSRLSLAFLLGIASTSAHANTAPEGGSSQVFQSEDKPSESLIYTLRLEATVPVEIENSLYAAQFPNGDFAVCGSGAERNEPNRVVEVYLCRLWSVQNRTWQVLPPIPEEVVLKRLFVSRAGALRARGSKRSMQMVQTAWELDSPAHRWFQSAVLDGESVASFVPDITNSRRLRAFSYFAESGAVLIDRGLLRVVPVQGGASACDGQISLLRMGVGLSPRGLRSIQALLPVQPCRQAIEKEAPGLAEEFAAALNNADSPDVRETALIMGCRLRLPMALSLAAQMTEPQGQDRAECVSGWLDTNDRQSLVRFFEHRHEFPRLVYGSLVSVVQQQSSEDQPLVQTFLRPFVGELPLEHYRPARFLAESTCDLFPQDPACERLERFKDAQRSHEALKRDERTSHSKEQQSMNVRLLLATPQVMNILLAVWSRDREEGRFAVTAAGSLSGALALGWLAKTIFYKNRNDLGGAVVAVMAAVPGAIIGGLASHALAKTPGESRALWGVVMSTPTLVWTFS